MLEATIGAEDLSYFSAIKCWQQTKTQKVFNLAQSSSKKLVHVCTNCYPAKGYEFNMGPEIGQIGQPIFSCTPIVE